MLLSYIHDNICRIYDNSIILARKRGGEINVLDFCADAPGLKKQRHNIWVELQLYEHASYNTWKQKPMLKFPFQELC